jgi:hypothetical protein
MPSAPRGAAWLANSAPREADLMPRYPDERDAVADRQTVCSRCHRMDDHGAVDQDAHIEEHQLHTSGPIVTLTRRAPCQRS